MVQKLLILVSLLCVVGGTSASADTQNDRKKQIDKLMLADEQNGRKRFIDKLINQGIFQKVEVADNLPHVWVTPVFKTLDFQTKTNCVSVVNAYYLAENPGAYNMLIIVDGATGRSIGEYTKDHGGLRLQ